MKKRLFTSFVWLAIVFLFTMLALPVSAQTTIKRGGIKKKVTVAPRTTVKHATVKHTHKKAHDNDDNDNDYTVTDYTATADSVAADTTATEETEATKFETYHMVGGYELYGRSKVYTDNADGQKTLRDALSNCDNVKTAYLTDHKGVYIVGSNGYNSASLPEDMTTALKYCNSNKYEINDACMTDVGWWAVIYNDTNYRGNLPSTCKAQMDAAIGKGEKILSLSISENGNYAMITDKSFYASNETDRTVIEEAIKKYGHAYSVCITNVGTFVTCSRGAFFLDVPTRVVEKLQNYSGNPKFIRFTDSGTFIAVNGESMKAFFM